MKKPSLKRLPLAAVSIYKRGGSMTIHYGNTSIHLSKAGWEKFPNLSTYSSCAIISDDNVYPIYGKSLANLTRIPVTEVIFPAGEQSKSVHTMESCWRKMSQHNLDRQSIVIGLGGGVVTDIAGFVAATYMRGVDLIQIPTTLLGMVDAAIGGKTGIDLPEGKNLVGSLYQPRQIFISLPLLSTLPKREMISGLAEVIKYGVIGDPELFEYLEAHIDQILNKDSEALHFIIERSCRMKADVVAQDESERGLRAILNFGHTFGHALETLTHYSTFTHGEAVAIGMCCATRMSIKMGLCDPGLLNRLENLCTKAGLPTKLPQNIDCNQFIEAMTHDKKAQSRKINLILVQKLGKVDRFNDIEKDSIHFVLKESL
jgi:3-dehydroquinate synthase